MDFQYILLRYGELFLKGDNKREFENRLIKNIKAITGVCTNNIKKIRGRIILDYFPKHSRLKAVFGLKSYSPAVKVGTDVNEIKQIALRLLSEYSESKNSSFKVETHRSDKSFFTTSPKLNVLVGEYIEQNSNQIFKFNKADNLLKIEINKEGVYLFLETIPCCGGLPTGMDKEVPLLVNNQASLLAGLYFMKRGCGIFPIILGEMDINLLQKFSPTQLKSKKIHSLNELDSYIRENNFSTLILGENFEHFSKHIFNLVKFYPLIAYSDQQIISELNQFQELSSPDIENK